MKKQPYSWVTHVELHTRNKNKLPARVRPAVLLLMEAFQYANQANTDSWEFAVELDDLTALGLIRNDYRWLVRHGLIEHRREVTIEGDDGRAFRRNGDLTFPDGTCFVLTDKGISIARAIGPATTSRNIGGTFSASASGEGKDDEAEDSREPSTNGAGRKPAPSLPTWNAERRILRLNGTTVKHFKWPALNQEAILATFEEEGWPARVDDPLTPGPNQDPKRRLSDTIKCLNRKQKNKLIHFQGDGTGEAVTWDFVSQQSSDDEPSS